MPDIAFPGEIERGFRFLAENAKDGITVFSADGECLYTNRRTLELLGYSREEFRQVPMRDLIHPDHADTVLANFRARMSGVETPHVYETCLRRRDGTIFPAELTAEATTWMQRPADVVLVRDITEQKETEARLLREQDLNERLRREMEVRRRAEEELVRRDAISEAVSFAAQRFLQTRVWQDCIAEVFERLGRAAGVSRVKLWEFSNRVDGSIHIRFRFSWGIPATGTATDGDHEPGLTFPGTGMEPWLDLLRHGTALRDSLETYPEDFRRVLERRGVRSIMMVPVRADGELWGLLALSDTETVRFWSDLELDALQVAGSVFGTVIERERSERALRESEEKYRNVVESAHQSILLMDGDGRIAFANGLAKSSVGYAAADDLAGKRLHDVFNRETADVHLAQVRAALASGEARIYQNPAPVSGPGRWIETRIQPLRAGQNGRELALLFVNDITERFEAQARILAYQEHLRLLARELALTEQRARRKIAVDLHDRLGQSLAVAKIKLGGLRGGTTDGTVVARLDEVRSLIDHAIHETRWLTSELSPPVLYELGLEPALEWLAERFQAQHGLRTIFRDDGVCKPLGHDLRGILFQSTQELLLNVAKHAGARQVSVSVVREGDLIRVEVQDDGVGFDATGVAADRKIVSGFGLFSIRERLGSFGGTQEVVSKPGVGTRVSLRAPVRTEPEVKKGDPA